MRHRHLDLDDSTRYIAPAIDDIIARGKWQDWADLRRAMLADPALRDEVERICRPRAAADPYAQRHHFWLHYAQKHRPTP